MKYKYLAKQLTSEQEAMIVRDYFETPIDVHGNHLDHITHICQYYNITAPLLSVMVSNFKVFDTRTHCIHCNIMRQISEPTYNYQHQKFNWVCDDCHRFIHQSIDNNLSIVQHYEQDYDCPF